MKIDFFDDPLQQPKSREDVRIKRIGLYVHEGSRQVTFGIELTPFLERPSIEMNMVNGEGVYAGSLTVIETMTPNFSLIVHLRDEALSDPYQLTAEVYYATPETERVNIDRQSVQFSAAKLGEQIFLFT